MSIHRVIAQIMAEHNVDEDVARKILEEALKKKESQERMTRVLSERRSQSYHSWLQEVIPDHNWTYPYVHYISGVVDMIFKQQLTQVMIFLQPRIGKSTMITKSLPACWLERYPNTEVILGAYNRELAQDFSRFAMNLYRNRPHNRLVKDSVDNWITDMGGGCKTAGVGSGVTGRGGDLIIVDDPIKGFEEAYSITYRERVWNWWNTDLRTRRNKLDKTPTILILTRWHPDDLAGRILRSPSGPDWTVVKFPAIAPGEDVLGRKKGDVLAPDRFPRESLEYLRDKEMVLRDFNALYQQDPQADGTKMFSVDKINYVQPGNMPTCQAYVRFWDLAATQDGGDYTVGVLVGIDEHNRLFVEDVVRGQWSDHGVRSTMAAVTKVDHDRLSKMNADYEVWFQQDPGQAGKMQANDIITKWLPGHPVFSQTMTGSKTIRAKPAAAQMEAGNIYMMTAPWNKAFVDELDSFIPESDNEVDDQVDGFSGAVNKLTLERLQTTVR